MPAQAQAIGTPIRSFVATSRPQLRALGAYRAMHDVRSQLKTYLVPKLRAIGFKGSFPHFRRRRDDRNELITFQFEKYGSGKFVVELAVAPAGTFKTYWGKEVSESKLTAHDLSERLRLGAVPGENYWFSLNDDPAPSIDTILEFIKSQGDTYFEANT